MRQRTGAAYLDDVIHAFAVGQRFDRFSPLGCLAVVDGVLRAEATQALQLLIGRGGRDHSSPHQLGELQRKDRHPAGTQYQHGIARFQAAVHHQRAPSGQSCGGQRGGFYMAVADRLASKPCGRSNYLLAGIAIDAIARGGGKVAYARRAFQPVWEEGRDDRIAHGKLFHTFANGFHHARAVGHRDALIVGGNHPRHDRVVVKVQRAGVQAHFDLAGAWLPRGCHVDNVQFI